MLLSWLRALGLLGLSVRALGFGGSRFSTRATFLLTAYKLVLDKSHLTTSRLLFKHCLFHEFVTADSCRSSRPRGRPMVGLGFRVLGLGHGA